MVHAEEMDVPIDIDLATWPRSEHFEHYRHRVPCTYAMTVEIDVTDFVDMLRRSSRKSYIAQVWALALIVNRHDEFRTCLNESGRPALWPVSHPSFTVFNPDRETFASVWVPFDADFDVFHEAAAAVLARYRTATALFPLGAAPANTFDVSSVPWTSFTGFTLNIRDGWEHFAPIFTLGRYVVRAGRTYLPVAIQLHHAVADGFHAARLVTELEALLSDPDWVTPVPVLAEDESTSEPHRSAGVAHGWG